MAKEAEEEFKNLLRIFCPESRKVKKLLDKRIRNRNIEYLVAWEGYYGPDERSWEPKKNLNSDLIQKFEEDLQEEMKRARESAPVRGFDRGLQV